jgi:hypothetical protein
LLWWAQSQKNIEVLANPGWIRPNWAYTGYTLTNLLLDGKWHKAEYRLRNDPADWTYGGGNGGYQYWSIDRALGHLNIDFFHMLAYIDVRNPPAGAIDFDELTIAYRNYSLLLPSNGGKLVSAPPGGEDPARLTDGWRHGKDRTWRSAADPSAALEFVYSFARPVTIHTVQLHQNPDWPAKDVEILAAADGTSFTQLLKKTLPERGTPNANWAYTIDRGLSAKAAALKVRIVSGYRPQHWGLGEIEVFGTGAVMLPDDDLYNVNTDIENLAPGTTYHYRLVAVGSAGTAHGEDQSFTTPASKKPLCATGAASRITTSSAKVGGRLNALGEPATFYFEYGLNANYGSKTIPLPGGLQLTPRTAYGHLTGLEPATTYHYRLVVVNATGTTYGADATFQTQRTK